jgi:RND family efflux transporter MFP subunit
MSDPSSKKRTGLYLGAAGLVIAALVGGGLASRGTAEREQAAIAAENALPTVSLVQPRVSEGGEIVLPGNLEPFNRAAINARVSGYVREWRADIGDRVRRGQTLAILDAPEIDQQLAQAQAAYQTAAADRGLAETTAARWGDLLEKDAVSRQEADERQGQFAAADARARAAQADVGRLRALTGFTRLAAPFDGVVTSRSAQLGALVQTGSAGAEPLFTVADVSRLRLYVRVPQALSGQLARGTQATFSVPERPGEVFEATLSRLADAVDRQSGAMLVEFLVDNSDRRLRPGGYAEVRVSMPGGAGMFQVPASALILGSDGARVAVVDGQGQVTLREVPVGRDQGATIEILSGLRPTDRIVQTPPDALATGDRVRIVPARQPAAPNAKR